MLQQIKRHFWIVLLVLGLEAAPGFSLLGPYQTWHVPTIGYALAYEETLLPGGPVWLGDVGGPHNFMEDYRRTAPILYYAYDPSFDEGDFFGYQGQAAIDAAFSIMNGITNVDKFSAGLDEFPLTAQHQNYTAEALYLTDIKSVTLHLLVEQLGLADPARYSWTLHDRSPGPTCPLSASYLVVQRNFDGTAQRSSQNLVYSPYVNNTLLSYYISEACSGNTPLARTVIYLTDPEGNDFIPVAANNFQEFEDFDTGLLGQEGFITKVPTIYGLQIGGYYSSLTKDDVAGLRFLYTTNNLNYEQLPATSLLFGVATNTSLQFLLPGNPTNIPGSNIYYYFGSFDSNTTVGYGDYGFLIATSLTNDPATLQGLFPGLIISSSSNYFVLATNYTYTQYFTNSSTAGQVYPAPVVLVTVTNRSYYLQERWVYRFANVFPHIIRPTTTVKRTVVVVQPQAGSVYPAPLVTNVTTTSYTKNTPSGDFFVLPMFHTNICPLDILRVGLTNVSPVTNFLAGSTNNVTTVATNGSTFSGTYVSAFYDVTYFTNYVFVINPVTCSETPAAPNRYRGVGGVRFVRNDYYDYLTVQYLVPITNFYTVYSWNETNLVYEKRSVTRIITQPDILLSAADLAVGPAGNNFNGTVTRNLELLWRSPRGVNAPGTIDGQLNIVYNRVGSIFENAGFIDANSFINPDEVNETTQVQMLQWASYDSSTNAPILYPNGTSFDNLENQAVIQLFSIPTGPLVGDVGLPYTVQFNATGGPFVPAFTWSVSSVPGEFGSGLPPGLSLDTNTGIISGTPSASGTYDFVLTLTDSTPYNPKSVSWTISITIN